MSKNYINKIQIVKKISPLADISTRKTNEIIEELEEIIAKNLKTRRRVIISNFGSFYLITMSSHTIKSIGTKAPRLLVEQNQVKFRPTKEFRFEITQERIVEKTSQDETKVQIKTSPRAPFIFKPLSIMPKVDRETIRKKIHERMLRIAQDQTQTPPKTVDAVLPTRVKLREDAEGRALGALIKYAAVNNIDNFHLSLGPSETVDIFHSRPRVKLASLPAQTVRNFLNTYFELETYDVPQERDVQFFLSDTGSPVNVRVFSLPTESGIIVYFKITQRKI